MDKKLEKWHLKSGPPTSPKRCFRDYFFMSETDEGTGNFLCFVQPKIISTDARLIIIQCLKFHEPIANIVRKLKEKHKPSKV